MSNAEEIPEDTRRIVKTIFDELMFLFRDHSAKVMTVEEVGPDAGSIQVYCPDIDPSQLETNPLSWIPALPGNNFYRNFTPDIGDWVLIYYPERTQDKVFYKALDPVEYIFKKIGPGLKVLFEYSDEIQNTAAIYFDKINMKLVVEYGLSTVTISNTGIEIASGIVPSEATPLGETLQTALGVDRDALQELQAALTAWTPAPLDGGAALKTALTAFLALPMADYTTMLSTQVKNN